MQQGPTRPRMLGRMVQNGGCISRGYCEQGRNPTIPCQDIDQEAGPSGSRPSRKQAAVSHQLNKLPRKASKAAEWEAKQRHKAIEKAIEKAQRETEKKARSLQIMELSCSQPFTSRQLELPDIQEELPAAAWSPNGAMEQASNLPSNSELLFGSMPEPKLPEASWEQPIRQRISTEATFTPTTAGLRSEERLEPQIPARMGALISEAIRRDYSWVATEGSISGF